MCLNYGILYTVYSHVQLNSLGSSQSLYYHKYILVGDVKRTLLIL